MFITSVKNVMRASEENDHMELVLKIQVEKAKRLLQDWSVEPTIKQIELVREATIEYTDLDLNLEEMTAIINLYPSLKIEVAGMRNYEEIKESLCFAISHLILGCPWPTHGDKVDMKEYLVLLHVQAEKIGFKVVKN